jgi:hypothetical protein
MNDMSSVIVPKSDQINADTLIAGPMTVTIREVQIRGGQEQPVSIMLEETELAYRPCKSMSRVLVQAWGPDAKTYVGRRLTLYRDPTVKWAGMEVGGIRISHLSHIDGKMQMQLTATKGQRKPHIVMPLTDAPEQTGTDKEREWADKFIGNVNRAPDAAKLDAFVAGKAKLLGELKDSRPQLHAECEAAINARKATFADPDDDADDDDEDPFADDTRDAFGLEPLADQHSAEPGATADWRAKADEFLGSIRNAKRTSYLDAIADDYRTVAVQMPKELADQVEAAMTAKKAELDK